MIPVWPPTLRQFPRRRSWTGGPRDERVTFEPDRGPPIDRVGATAQTFEMAGLFPNLSDAQRAEFIRWFREDLAMGTRWYAWRDPVTLEVALWKIITDQQAFSFTSNGAGWHDLSLRVMRRAFTPWWGEYCATGPILRPPAIVADYAGSVFGVDLARTPASSVAAASGTFDVVTTTGGVATLQAGVAVSPGGIPATAPAGVASVMAYVPL